MMGRYLPKAGQKQEKGAAYKEEWGTRCFSLQRVLASTLVGAGQSPMRAGQKARTLQFPDHRRVTRGVTLRVTQT